MRWEIKPLQQGLLYQAMVWPVEGEGPKTQIFSTKTEAAGWVQGFALCPVAALLTKLDEMDWVDLLSLLERMSVNERTAMVNETLKQVHQVMKGVK